MPRTECEHLLLWLVTELASNWKLFELNIPNLKTSLVIVTIFILLWRGSLTQGYCPGEKAFMTQGIGRQAWEWLANCRGCFWTWNACLCCYPLSNIASELTPLIHLPFCAEEQCDCRPAFSSFLPLAELIPISASLSPCLSLFLWHALASLDPCNGDTAGAIIITLVWPRDQLFQGWRVPNRIVFPPPESISQIDWAHTACLLGTCCSPS